MQVTRGRAKTVVAEEALKYRHRNAGFEQMRRERVPKRMNSTVARQSRLPHGPVERPLHGRIAQRTPWLEVRGKEPVLGSIDPPILAQLGEEPGRKDRIAVLGALALHHVYLSAFAQDVFRAQPAHLAASQSRCVGDHQQRAVFDAQALRLQQTRNLLGAVDTRPQQRLFHPRQSRADLLERPMQHMMIEKAQRAHIGNQCAAAAFLIAQQIQHVGLELVVRDQIGRTAVVAGQAGYDADVAVTGKRGEPA